MAFDKNAFREWLEEHLKRKNERDIWDTHDFNAYCADLERQRGEIGQNRYELTRWETASGNPEEYSYTYIDDSEED